MAEFTSDGSGVYAVMSAGHLPARLVPHVKLLSDLQTVHDDPSAERSDWPELLKRVASNHELDPAVVDEAFAAAKAA